MSGLPNSTRYAWLMVATLGAVVIALSAFILKQHAGAGTVDSIFVAAGGFVVSLPMFIGVLAYMKV